MRKPVKLIDGKPMPLPSLPGTVFFIIVLLALLFTISAYFPISIQKDGPLVYPGQYITLNTTYRQYNMFPENSVEIFDGIYLFYFYFPENTFQPGQKRMYLLSDATILRDRIGVFHDGGVFGIYPGPCSKSIEGYSPDNYFYTKSAVELKGRQVICVKPIFGNYFGRQRSAEFGVASFSNESVTLQVISVND